MKWLRTVMTLTLVAIWLPVSSHALLQHVGFIHEVHEHDHTGPDHNGDSNGPHEHNANNHDAADGQCVTPAGKVSVPMPAFVLVPNWLAVPILAPLINAGATALHSGLSPPSVSPPELSHRWQFSFRAALLARAPSLIS